MTQRAVVASTSINIGVSSATAPHQRPLVITRAESTFFGRSHAMSKVSSYSLLKNCVCEHGVKSMPLESREGEKDIHGFLHQFDCYLVREPPDSYKVLSKSSVSGFEKNSLLLETTLLPTSTALFEAMSSV